MPVVALDPRIEALLEGPNFGHVATLMAGGAPHSAPVWIGLRQGRLAFVKEERAVATANLRRDPRLAVSVSAVEDPYESAYLRGRVVETRDGAEAAEWLDQAAIRYTGSAYPKHKQSLVLLLAEIEQAGFWRSPSAEHTPPGRPLHLTRS